MWWLPSNENRWADERERVIEEGGSRGKCEVVMNEVSNIQPAVCSL